MRHQKRLQRPLAFFVVLRRLGFDTLGPDVRAEHQISDLVDGPGPTGQDPGRQCLLLDDGRPLYAIFESEVAAVVDPRREMSPAVVDPAIPARARCFAGWDRGQANRGDLARDPEARGRSRV